MFSPILFRGHAALLSGCLLTVLLCLGCKPKPAVEAPAPDVQHAEVEPSDLSPPSGPVPPNVADSETAAAQPQPPAAPSEPPTFELSAEALLAARLPAEQTAEGWVRLFDGSTLFGWQITDSANWRVEDGAIVVDAGQRSFLATTSIWDNYELELEFQADAETNSGVFLRTQLQPESVANDCYELNIAPTDNPFPTGSLVERQRVEPQDVGEIDPQQWHSYHVRVEDQTVTVQLDGKEILRYEDPNRIPAGLISLQHREGRVAFRDIRIRPLGLEPLLADDNLAQWKQHPQFEGEFTIDAEGNLSIKGGSGQLESRAQFGDFALLARCRTNAKDLNSGIFFRCIPGEKMNGYECQISNETVDGDPLKPGDAGTGGIFRRQPARIVAGEDGQWVSILLVANGPTMMAWVNGLQVSNWTDTRDPDPNPRRGLRLQPGTLMLQAHDPTTDLSFSDISVAAIGPAPEPAWPAEETE